MSKLSGVPNVVRAGPPGTCSCKVRVSGTVSRLATFPVYRSVISDILSPMVKFRLCSFFRYWYFVEDHFLVVLWFKVSEKLNFGENWKFWRKIEILAKNRNFGEK